ncbi:MAG: TonB-dependent receptor [Steroidobacteraceae bacterium]|jgi:outer membrane receptor protein involved in Fe transport
MSRGAAGFTAVSFVACILSAPPQAWAQQAPAAQSQTSQSSSQLEPVVVTASRQGEQNIQDIPMAISAITPQSLETFGLSGMEDYSRMVPSLNLQQLGPGINKIDIRGITTSGIDYTDVQDRPLVTVYLDDTPISLQAQNPDLKVFDLERVEVLRGPQGTLYGAGAMSGTVRLITKKPDLNQVSASSGVDASDTSGYGGFNYNIRQMVNLPIIDGVLAMRAIVYRGDDSGFIKNIEQNDTGHPDVTNQARLALRYKPNDNLTIDGSFTYEDLHAGVYDGFSGLPAYQFTSLEPELTTDSLKVFNLTAEQNFHSAVLTSSTSILDRNNANFGANEYGVNAFLFGGQAPLDPALDVVSDNSKDFVEELRLSSNSDGKLKWTSGVFYEHFERYYYQNQPDAPGFDQRWGNEIGFPTYSSLDDGAFQPNDDFSGVQDSGEHQTAVFGQATYTVLPNLDVTAGLRYFDWHQDFVLYFGGVFGASPIASSPTSPGVPLKESGTASASGINPRYAIDYHFSDDEMVFAEAAKGFRYGGVNQPVPQSICEVYLQQIGLTQAPLTFGPDKLWSYSLGEKSSLLDRRLTLNVTGFFIYWTDVQTTRDLACSYYFIENKGTIESRGLELETQARITQALTFGFNGSYNNATTDGLVQNLNAPSGSRTPYDPKWITNTTLTYDLPLGDDTVSFATNFSYRSGAATAFNPTAYGYRTLPDVRDLDAAITYKKPRFQVGLFGSNLTNGLTIINNGATVPGSLQPGDTLFYARPRTVGVRIAAQFQ